MKLSRPSGIFLFSLSALLVILINWKKWKMKRISAQIDIGSRKKRKPFSFHQTKNFMILACSNALKTSSSLVLYIMKIEHQITIRWMLLSLWIMINLHLERSQWTQQRTQIGSKLETVKVLQNLLLIWMRLIPTKNALLILKISSQIESKKSKWEPR